MPAGDVNITIVDNGTGSVIVPGASVQVVMGTSSTGTVNAVVATRSPNTLQTTSGYGPLPEAAALAALSGGTILAIRLATAAAGSATAVTFTGTGTSVITVTGAPYDTYLVQFLVVTGGIIGTAGIIFKVSLDGGKTYGPNLALGTANTFLISNTNITLNFAAGDLDAGDFAKFSTTAPEWDTAGVLAALTALAASPYAITGWGSMHIPGVCSGAEATTIQGYLNTFETTNFIYTRAMLAARDAAIPVVWGGAGETEAVWMASLGTDFAAVSAKRILATSGHYNMPSAYANSHAGAPRYRRPLSWALAARQVVIPPQRHAGRVSDGSLANIVIDPTVDPTDGFIYHDERINPGLDGFRFASARTRIGLPGFYIVNPNLFSAAGSDFTILPLGNVMDNACTIVRQAAQQFINSDIRLNANGTIYENEARGIESVIQGQLQVNMIATSQISGSSVVVDRSNNVLATDTVNISVTITARGYVLTENVTIQFQNPFTAGS